MELVIDLPRGTVLFMEIGSGQVEIELVEGGLGHEVGAMAERFQIKEFISDEAMDGFDVALIRVGAGQAA